MKVFELIFCVYFLTKCADSAKILAVFPLEWGSHYILGIKLVRGLAEAGHDITMISPRKYKNPPKNGSWTDIVLGGPGEEFTALLQNANLYDYSKKNALQKMQGFTDFLIYMAHQTLRHPRIQELIHSKATFDAVIVDYLMNECHHIFAYHFKCPLILLSSIGPNTMINPKVGNPAPVSTIPNFTMQIDESKQMIFFDRLKNLLLNIFMHLFFEFYILPQHNLVVHEMFPNAPEIHSLLYNVSLILLNSHTSLVKAVPVVPNMVEIGGYHIDPPQKLPADLQEFLDGAKDGAIYFSMGSSLKSKDMPEEKKKALLGVFSKLKQNILWKFEEDLPGMSANVLIKIWMPQQDILAHPNIKLFITHGGLLSSTETIYHGVPVLVIPVFGDQEMNAQNAVESGFGLKISYNDENFNEETLHELIQELLNNPIYHENAQSRSKLFHDRPMTPLQTVVYWVEYVIRHKGATHLRVAGIGMPWYKYFMLDVLAATIISTIVVILCIKYIFRILKSLFLGKAKQSVKLKTK